MPTDFQGFRRSIFSMKRDSLVHSIDTHTHEHPTAQEQELEAFQTHVTQSFHDLSSFDSHQQLLSLSWLSKLLHVFLSCEEHFRAVLFNNKSLIPKQPLDRLVSDYFDRTVKALDVCNAIRDGIEQIRQSQKQLEIVLCALDHQKSLGEGQFRRAKKVLIDLSIYEKESSCTAFAHGNQSFGRSQKDSQHQVNKSLKIFRSLSWSVSRSWSAAKQLQAIGNTIVPMKTNEVIASNGLAVAVYTMNHVLLFVMWALVAAIPCHDRGLQTTHFNITRSFVWGDSILALHERILEESKKRDRRNSCGLLKEIVMIETSVSGMHELIDSVQFPLGDEKEREVRTRVDELSMVYEAIKNGLDPLEKQLRDVFHGIVRSRSEGLEFVSS